MDGQTLTKLAKAHATLITQYTDITQAEAFSLVGQIMQFIAGGNTGVGESISFEGSKPANPPAPRATGLEDAPGEGAVLAKPGANCICSTCKSPIYEVIAEVRGKGMGVNSFLQAFRPIGHDTFLTREMLDVVKDNNGNTYMDCPICKGVKTLQLLGKSKVNIQKSGVAPVGSVGAGDLT